MNDSLGKGPRSHAQGSGGVEETQGGRGASQCVPLHPPSCLRLSFPTFPKRKANPHPRSAVGLKDSVHAALECLSPWPLTTAMLRTS